MKNIHHTTKFIAIAVLLSFFVSCGKNSTELSLIVCPNPSDNNIVLICDNMQHFTIFDAIGQLVKDEDVPDVGFYNVDVSDLAPGNYLLQVTTTNGIVSKTISIMGFNPWYYPYN